MMITSILLFSIVNYIQNIKPISIKKFRENVHNCFSVVIRGEKGQLNMVLDPIRGIFLPVSYLPKSKRIRGKYSYIKKVIDGSRIIRVYQPRLERIVIFVIRNWDEEFNFIIELFGGGNIILTNSEGEIVFVDKPLKVRDRKLVVKERYEFPPPRGLEVDELRKYKKEYMGYKDVFSKLPLDKYSVNEVIYRAGYTDGASAVNTSDIIKHFESLLNEAAKSEIYCISRVNDGSVILTPYKPTLYDIVSCSNEIVDISTNYYYTYVFSAPELERRKKEKDIEKRLVTLEKEYLNVLNQISELEEVIPILYTKIGELYLLFDELKKGEVKDRKIVNVDRKNRRVTIKLEDKKVTLNYNLSVNAAINELYERLKRLKRGKDLLADKINELKEQLLLKKDEKRMGEVSVEEVWLRSRKKKWYEKYRWFITSDDLLTIGGKDARTNEAIIKKYLEERDLVFHSDVYGSPFVILKDGLISSTDTSLFEAAVFTASYSRAWREGFSAIDVYWVKKDQVSKTTPSGEYLKKGAFMIYGKKNFIRNVKLELYIGLYEIDGYPVIFIGPEAAVIRHCKDTPLIKVFPGDNSKSRSAYEIVKYLTNFIDKPLSKIDTHFLIDDLIGKLPPGTLDYIIVK